MATKTAPAPIAKGGGYVAPTSSTRATRIQTEDEAVAAEAAQAPPVPAAPASTGTTAFGAAASGTNAVAALLETIGIDPTTANTQAGALLTAINNSGLDPTSASDTTAVQAFTDTWLPQQSFFQQRFPGIVAQINAGQSPMSPVDYINLEDTMKGIATQYGLDPNVMASPDVIAHMVTSNTSAAEMSTRFNTYMDAYESEAPEVQQAYNQFYGINGATAYAAQIANVGVTDDQLKLQQETAQIGGAGAQLGVTVGQPTASRLAGLGVTYQQALAAGAKTVQESGLYTQTVGEQTQSTGPGATPALTSEEAFSANTAAGTPAQTQALEQEKENRENQFRGGGGASSTQAEGFEGIGSAKSS